MSTIVESEKAALRACVRGLQNAGLKGSAVVEVELQGGIEEQTITPAIEALQQAALADTVFLHIDSPGGDYGQALRMVGALVAFPGKIITHGGRQCGSAAFSIYLMGSVRFADENCLFAIHDGEGVEGQAGDIVEETIIRRALGEKDPRSPLVRAIVDLRKNSPVLTAEQALGTGLSTHRYQEGTALVERLWRKAPAAPEDRTEPVTETFDVETFGGALAAIPVRPDVIDDLRSSIAELHRGQCVAIGLPRAIVRRALMMEVTE